MLIFFLILIFLRPFISSLAFPYLNLFYSILFLFFIILWIACGKASLNKAGRLKYPLILFSAALILSLSFSVDKSASFRELYKYVSGLLLLIAAANMTREDGIRVIRAIVFSGLIISILAIYQFLFGFQNVMDYVAQHGISDPFILDYINRGRVFLPFVSPNILAGYLIMVIPLAAADNKEPWLTIPLCAALLLTRSIGALISICLALTIYFLILGRLKKKNAILLILILIIIASLFMIRSASGKQHLQPAFSTLMRLNYWEDTLKIIARYPLAGIGIGNFTIINSRYAHNSYLQIWSEMGVLGIISFLWLAIAALKPMAGNNTGPRGDKIISGLFIANTAFLLHNLLDFSFYLPEVSLIWWINLGLLTGFFHSRRQSA
ncbi:MAG: O-antigen ligase family protein [Candidatus Omnitrophota bacterium]|jgi:O-antigen ligase